MSAKCYLSVVLHAHLPFVRRPDKDWVLEEDWFYEAVTETYVPLILMIERLAKDNIRPSLTISISPTLCALLEDELLEKRCRDYIENRLELLAFELENLPENDPRAKTATLYQTMFEQALEVMDRYSGDLITPFKQFQQNGLVEIITSSATHSILPLLIHPEAIKAQILTAAQDYTDRFSRRPKGIWLPECAYEGRVAQPLQLAGIKYFFLDHHGLTFGNPAPKNGVYAPVRLKGGLFAYARDSESAKEVWSSKFGYPGHGAYREFYKDIGFDAEYEYIKPFLHEDGVRRSLGIKYHKITGQGVPLESKELYNPEEAAAQARQHAAEFLRKRLESAERVYAEKGLRPVIVGTYDAELFGHWWFEGPIFLENMIRLIRQERMPIQMVTSSEYLDSCPEPQEIEPESSSWGEGGYFEPWVNDKNDWVYPRINAITERMVELANKYRYHDLTGLENRALNQAAREVLLSQNSDWAFLMYVGSHSEYAEKRIMEHCANFNTLAKMITERSISEDVLRELESRNNIFLNVDFRAFASASAF